jgi:hypothetical protein
MAHDPRREESDLSKYLPLLLILGAGVLLYFGLNGQGGGLVSSGASRSDPRVKNRVNSHLEKTVETMEMRKTQMIIQNTRAALEYGQTKPEVAVAPPSEGVDLRKDVRADIVAEDLGRETRVHSIPSNPTDLIHSQLFAEESQKAEDAAFKAEYARQFIQNAKAAGWEVQLDDNYKVISVKKARAPSQSSGKGFQLFEEGSAGGF